MWTYLITFYQYFRQYTVHASIERIHFNFKNEPIRMHDEEKFCRLRTIFLFFDCVAFRRIGNSLKIGATFDPNFWFCSYLIAIKYTIHLGLWGNQLLTPTSISIWSFGSWKFCVTTLVSSHTQRETYKGSSFYKKAFIEHIFAWIISRDMRMTLID